MKEYTVTITAEEIQEVFIQHGKDVTMAQAEVLLTEYISNRDCPILGGLVEDQVAMSLIHFAKTEDLSDYIWD